jgi:hypothetical protein
MATFPVPPAAPKPGRPVGPKKAPVVSRGPRVYNLTKEPTHLGPPGEPPEGFLTVKTTRPEWYIYWALARVLGMGAKARDVRSAPFDGGLPLWTYQAYVDASAAAQTNIDFVIWAPFPRGTPIAIRVQTEYFHNFASSATQAYDRTHRERLQGGFEVADVFDFDFMRDKTGRAAVVLVKKILGLIEPGNAQRSGRLQRV